MCSNKVTEHTEHDEKMELSHEPVPPYRSVFFVAIAVASFYLGLILFMTMT